jgi:hypothetical protein
VVGVNLNAACADPSGANCPPDMSGGSGGAGGSGGSGGLQDAGADAASGCRLLPNPVSRCSSGGACPNSSEVCRNGYCFACENGDCSSCGAADMATRPSDLGGNCQPAGNPSSRCSSGGACPDSNEICLNGYCFVCL